MCYKGFLVFSALADLSIQILVQIPLYYNTFRDIIYRYVIFYHTLIHFASINLFFIVAFYIIIGFLLSFL